jgi:hypothetical protein
MNQKQIITYQFSILLILVANISLCFYFASRGIDLSDQAYPLAITDWTNPYFFPSLGSIVVNKILALVFQNYALLASKFIAQVSPLILVYFAYKLLFKEVLCNQAYIAIMLLITFWSNRVTLAEWTYYNTLSMLLISLANIFMAHAIQAKKFYGFYISLAFLFISIICKISNLVFLIYIPIFILFFYITNKDDIKKIKQIRNFILASTIILILLSSIIFLSSFKTYLLIALSNALYFVSQSRSYSFQATYLNIWRDGAVYWHESIIFIIYLISAFLIDKYQLKAKYFNSIMLSALFLSLQYYFKLYEWNGLFFFYLMSLTYLIFSKKYTKYRFLSLSCLLFLLLSSLGSANGLKPAFVSETIICLLLMTVCIEKFKCKFLIVSIVITLAIIGISNKTVFSYRDLNKFELNTKSSIPKLAGLYSHEAKMNLLEELYVLRKDLSSTNSTAIIYPSAPLLHYILDLKPFLPNPWVNLYPESQLRSNLNSLESWPDYIIKLKQSPRTKEWPNNRQSLERDRDIASIKVIDEYAILNKYQVTKETANYIIYKY